MAYNFFINLIYAAGTIKIIGESGPGFLFNALLFLIRNHFVLPFWIELSLDFLILLIVTVNYRMIKEALLIQSNKL